MNPLMQSVAFAVAGIIGAATAAYIDAYHVLEITDAFKFRTPAAVWQFQFGIWWPIVLIMTFLFGVTSTFIRKSAKSKTESRHLLFAPIAAITLVTILYLTPKLVNHSAAFVLVMLAGPMVAATIIQLRFKTKLESNAT